MDRRKFIRNIFGATAAVTIGKVIEPLAITAPIQEGVQIGAAWMSLAEYNAMKAWFREIEMQFWFGRPFMDTSKETLIERRSHSIPEPGFQYPDKFY